MSRSYEVDVTLNATYTHENISKIIKNSLKIDFIYLEQGENVLSYNLIPRNQILSTVLNKIENNKELDFFICFHHVVFDFGFTNSTEGFLRCYLFMMGGSRLLKESPRFIFNTSLDWAKYIRLLMTITCDFAIKEVETNIL